MRLFTAIDLSDEARRAIAGEQTRIRRELPDASLRWVRPDHMHLTLAFIGEVAPVRGAAVVECMSAPLPQRPFRLVFGGVGVFPPHGAPRVLWLGSLDGAREAVELQRAVALRLESVGVPRGDRVFHPHLTLGRWRDGRPAWRGSLAQQGAVPVAEVAVAAVTLYQSRLSSSGPAYTALARAPLRCP